MKIPMTLLALMVSAGLASGAIGAIGAIEACTTPPSVPQFIDDAEAIGCIVGVGFQDIEKKVSAEQVLSDEVAQCGKYGVTIDNVLKLSEKAELSMAASKAARDARKAKALQDSGP
jgi:hypothetical protein